MNALHLLPTVGVLLLVAGVASADEPKGDAPKKAVARMVYYSGMVQGVGFRATVRDIAQMHPVTGWVKNLDDGRVQLLVEGKEEDVKKFLDAVRSYWKKQIDKEQVEQKEPTGMHRGFSVVR